MKKKYAIITLSLLLVVASTVLLINKSSYAAAVPGTNYCPNNVIANTSSESLALIEYQNTKITLPKIELTVDGEKINNAVIKIDNNTNITNQRYIKQTEFVEPYPTFSNNQDENAYYTQLFEWYMSDLYGDSNNLTATEQEAIENSTNGKKLITAIEEYEKYGNWISSVEGLPVLTLDNIDTSKIAYYATNDYIETNLITPEAPEDYAYVFTNYTVEVTSPITVVDENGNEKTDFRKGEGFKLRIPLSEIKNNEINFEANIIGRGEFKIWGGYIVEQPRSTASRTLGSPTLFVDCGKTRTIEEFETLNLNYTQQVGTLKIQVIDAESKEGLKDAEVVISDQMGNIVYRYKTTGNELNITLPVGEYTVKQIVTPPNYEARVVEQKISVIQNRETEAVLENIQLIEVPDTSKTATTISVISGLIILVGGIMIIMSIMRKTKNRPSPSNKN